MANASVAALSRIIWLFSKIASAPLRISIVTSEMIKNIIGTAEAIGEGRLFLETLLANVLIFYMY